MGFLISPYISFPVALGPVGTAPTASDTVAYWKLEDVTDSVGSNDLTNVGATNGTAKIANGYDFDGVNDYMTVPTAFDSTLTGDFSVSFWIKIDNLDPASFSESWIICFRAERNVQIKYTATGAFKFNFFTGTNYDTTTSTGYTTGVWYHILCTKSGTNGAKIYVDGVLDGSDGAATGTPSTNTAGSSIGDYKGSLTNYQIDGIVDEVALYDVELTADNALYLAQNGTPTTAQQYPFGDFTANNIVFLPMKTSLVVGSVDLGTTGNDLTNTGVTYDGTDDAFNYDGTNDYSSLTLVAWDTLSVWIKPNAEITTSTNSGGLVKKNGAFEGIIFGGFTGNATNEMISIAQNGSTAFFYWDSTAVSSITTSSHNIILIWESANSNYRLIYDGVDKGLASTFGTPTQITAGAGEVGRYSTIYYDGSIKSFGEWSSEFSVELAQELYALGNDYDPYA